MKKTLITLACVALSGAAQAQRYNDVIGNDAAYWERERAERQRAQDRYEYYQRQIEAERERQQLNEIEAGQRRNRSVWWVIDCE